MAGTAVDQHVDRRFDDSDDDPRSPAPPVEPAIACLLCGCPSIWFSRYGDGVARCEACEPIPGRSVVGSRWLLVVEVDDQVEANTGADGQAVDRFAWELHPFIDFRKWQPTFAAAVDGDALPSPGGLPPAGVEGPGSGDAIVGDANASNAIVDGQVDPDDPDDPHNGLTPPVRIRRTPAEVMPGTLLRFRTPEDFSTPWGSMTVYRPGWNDLVRLAARVGFDEAWRILGEREAAISGKVG